jgi:hypothetical protein
MRRQWVGHQAEVPKKTPREPVIRFMSDPLPFTLSVRWCYIDSKKSIDID